jgi:hypothetical protein
LKCWGSYVTWAWKSLFIDVTKYTIDTVVLRT